ncbi:hypothetical protein DER45DRAFT_580699 [Fusarium avenaceum]|nr:hypothetical protein DER45DRAFT_580699 [Fusarium avenaceum]
MVVQEIAPDKVKYKRVCGPKSRNGCITCRIRHLKCDEAKPVCKRCSNDKLKCDGYIAPKPRKPRRKPESKAMPKSRRPSFEVVPLRPCIHDMPSLTSQERLYFNHFFQFTSTQLSLSAESSNFWLQYVLPMGYQSESIRYSMIAVGTSHRLFMAQSLGDSDLDEWKSLAIQHYNKAITSIIPNIAASSAQDLHIIMICCLLFISFEGLTGRYDELLRHLSAGIELFHLPLPSSTVEDRIITERLAEMFCRLGVESSNFMNNDPHISGMKYWYRNNSNRGPQSPIPFKNFDEASFALRQLDVLYEIKPWYDEGSNDEHKVRLVTEGSKTLQDALNEWTKRFETLYQLRKEELLIKEEQQYHNLCVRQKYWQMAIDAHASEEAAADDTIFQPFLAAAREAAAPLIALGRPTFSLDGDLISGLTFVASTTTDAQIKVQALDLLWQLNRRESLLDSREIVEMHELARALETCTNEPDFDPSWEPTAAAGIPTIIERLRKCLGQLSL